MTLDIALSARVNSTLDGLNFQIKRFRLPMNEYAVAQFLPRFLPGRSLHILHDVNSLVERAYHLDSET